MWLQVSGEGLQETMARAELISRKTSPEAIW